jgi:hypothetical protein
MATAASWNLQVSPETDADLRKFLKSQGGLTEAEISRFVEEAVKAHMLELSSQTAKARNVDVDPAEIDRVVDEALKWARQP